MSISSNPHAPTTPGSGATAPSTQPLRSEFADDPEMAELVRFFVDRLPERVVALEQAAAAADWQTLATLAHQLKGSGGGYGYPGITASAAQVERLAKAQDQTQLLTQSLQELVRLCQRAVAGGPQEG
jgi:histidine phosphotransfer protein HptB